VEICTSWLSLRNISFCLTVSTSSDLRPVMYGVNYTIIDNAVYLTVELSYLRVEGALIRN
jgi:hypothetical protein